MRGKRKEEMELSPTLTVWQLGSRGIESGRETRHNPIWLSVFCCYLSALSQAGKVFTVAESGSEICLQHQT